MPYVLTVDQISSRTGPDLVEQRLRRLSVDTVLGFARTVGDEFQGVLEQPLSVVRAILELMRDGGWHIGLGIGPVETPLPAEPRQARGPAFLLARNAVEAAKREPDHVRVLAGPAAEQEAADAEVVLRLVATVRDRRSEQGWQAVDEMRGGATMQQAADRLGITRQAVGQRLRAANWAVERDTPPVLARLLERAEQASEKES
ncbi:hypothetical protein [Microlunatus speluncae]|uniref:hypothetical protein n=1 Tax=Microlunatus speluncae TaxID=2594267 RepID=UPI0012664FAC|nr:hypothetical protein [Microlunatus speluncae]